MQERFNEKEAFSKDSVPLKDSQGGAPTEPTDESVAGATLPEMPDLSWPQYGFYHTVDSALASLARLGIPAERITIKRAGRGWSPQRVIEQEPPVGSRLESNVLIALTVQGDGLFYQLPTGMREKGTELEPGLDVLMSIFDDPAEKAAYYARQGGLYFDVRPDNPEGCARWIRLFGMVPEDWPVANWFKLAVLLPSLHRVAGREIGVRLALDLLLGLSVAAIRWKPYSTSLRPEQLSRLGERAGCLGVDLVVGQGLVDEAAFEITLGPISLSAYRLHATPEGERRRDQVLRLVVPCHLVCSVKWVVGDREMAPHLGAEDKNSVLGINAYLGEKVVAGC